MRKQFFDESEFTATKWESASLKAEFANKLLNFILKDFPETLFSEKLYNRLSNTFGNIAHYSRTGFYGYWFSNSLQKAQFIENILRWPCWGDPEYTYSDVERALQHKVHELNLLQAARQRAADDVKRAELAVLDRLQKKYQSATVVPVPQPITVTPTTGEQLSLIA
jgi:hypothetical protein